MLCSSYFRVAKIKASEKLCALIYGICAQHETHLLNIVKILKDSVVLILIYLGVSNCY